MYPRVSMASYGPQLEVQLGTGRVRTSHAKSLDAYFSRRHKKTAPSEPVPTRVPEVDCKACT